MAKAEELVNNAISKDKAVAHIITLGVGAIGSGCISHEDIITLATEAISVIRPDITEEQVVAMFTYGVCKILEMERIGTDDE